MKGVVIFSAAIGAMLATAQANTVSLKPVADTTLFAFTPNNNSGKESTLVVGGIAKPDSACRTLLRFDLGTNLPAGAVITNVSLKLSVTKEKGASAAIQTSFHRMQQDWAEGAKSNKAGGSPAAAGEPTWNARKHGSENWTSPGATGDFVATASATIAIDNTGNYTIPSTDALLADVRDWQANPAINFGWILIAPQEGTQASARRIASREGGSQSPTLTIGFTLPPPAPEAPVANGSLSGDGQFVIAFPAQSGAHYEVQQRSVLDGSAWATAAAFNPTEAGTLTHKVPLAEAPAFFRVVLKP